MIENGVKAPEFAGALQRMIGLMDEMDVTLATKDWLSVDCFGLADAAVLPYVLRLDALAMTPAVEARANVAEWYQRVQALPAYETAVAKWTPPPVAEMLRKSGEAVWNEVEPLTKAG